MRLWFRASLAAALLAAAFGTIWFAVLSTPSRARAASSPSSEAEQPQVVRELPSLRTETSDTFLQSNGSRLDRVYAAPINFKNSAGEWQPIDDALVADSQGWHVAAASLPLSLPSSLGAGAVTVGSGPQQVGFQLQQAGGEGGRAAGSELTYSSVRPGVDVSYTPTAVGIRETLTLASATAPASYSYKLNYPTGLHPALNHEGGVDFAESSGHVLFQIAPPLVSDSAPGAHLPAAGQAHYELSSDGTNLALVISSSWLTDPSRVFPVRVDPDLFYSEQTDCAIVSGKYENSNLCNGALFIGPNSETPQAVGRSLLQFNLSSIPRDTLIQHSRLALWLKADTTTNPLEIEAYGLTRNFTQKATWNKYDGEHAWTTPGGDYTPTLAGKQKLTDSQKNYWVNWGFTALVQQWVQEPASNHGVLLKAANETTAGYDEFYQVNNSGKTDEPNMEIEYTCHTGVNEGDVLFGPELANGGELGVNASDGNLLVTSPDVSLQGEGYETHLTRFYNSRDENSTGYSLGKSWVLSTGNNTLLYPSPWDHSYAFHEEGGGWTRFDPTPPITSSENAANAKYPVPNGLNASLVVHENGTRTLTFNETGTEWVFDNSGNGFPQQIIEHEGAGNTISLKYIESKLSKVTDTHGHELTITREPGTVTRIESTAGEHWEYTYNSSKQLTSYKNPVGEETKYGYGSNGLLSEVIDTSGTYVISYDTHSPPRVTSIRKVINGTTKEVGSEDEVTSYEYKTPESPTCNPTTDEAETVVTYKPTGEPETFCFDANGHFTGPASERDEEAEGSGEPEEIAAGTCEEDPVLHKEDCVQEEPAPETIEDLPKADYGIADNNPLGTFNIFTQSAFTALEVTKVRHTVPWNMVSEAENNEKDPGDNPGASAKLKEIEEWIEKVRALHGGTGQPEIAFEDQCPSNGVWEDPTKEATKEEEEKETDNHECKVAPTKAQYEAAIARFIRPSAAHAALLKVSYFEALNEPNNAAPTGAEHVKPTWSATEAAYPGGPSGARVAGEYWRAAENLCAKRETAKEGACYVAAGDFLDSYMSNPYNGTGATKKFTSHEHEEKSGYKYFEEYRRGMGSQPKAYRWAWHPYTDGRLTQEHAEERAPQKWWTAYKAFVARINRFMKHSKYPEPNIWITEAGVVYFEHNAVAKGRVWESPKRAKGWMNAYVNHGSSQLTAKFPRQLARFFYYSVRGEPKVFDSGLLEAETLPEHIKPARKFPASAHREIYAIYKAKTPG